MQLVHIGDLLARRKDPIFIQDTKRYKRVTIRINHNGVCLRNEEVGGKIGTKRQFLTRAGDFILSRIDARHAAFGIVPDELEGAIITNDFWSFEINKELVDLEYFYIFSQSEAFLEACKKASKGTTNRKRIEEDFFLNYDLRLPDKKMQHEIVKRYKSAKVLHDKLNKENTHQLSLLEKLRQSILKEALQGKLVSQNPNDESAKFLLRKARIGGKSVVQQLGDKPFNIPSKWEWASFFEIADIKSNLVPPKNYQDYPHIAPDNIEKRTGVLLKINTIKEDKVMSGNHLFFKGQILLSKVRPNLQKAIISPLEGLCSADMYPIETVLNPQYLLFFFLSPLFLLLVSEHDNRVKMPKINQNQLNSFLVPVPPLREQAEIVKKITQSFILLDSIYSESRAQASARNTLAKILLMDLFQETLV